MPGVLVAYCSPLGVAARFTHSLTAMIEHDARTSRHLVGQVALISGPRVAEARSQIVDAFIQHESNPEWLLMLDADMVFEPDLLDRMMEVADPRSVPFLGALCFAGVHGGRMYPTLYKAYNEGAHFSIEPVDEYPDDTLVKVGATGAACTLIHRGVFAAMKRPSAQPGERFDPAVHGFGTLAGGQENPFPWYSEGLTTSAGIPLGEDIAFSRKCMFLGIPLYVHTGIKVGHAKEWVITEDDFDAYLRERERPAMLLAAAHQVLRRSGQFSEDQLDAIANYLRPRPGILGLDQRPAPEPFLLPEPEPVG